MIRFIKKLLKDRRGNALVVAGAAMPLLVGAAGLGSDTIQWVLWKRDLQRAADSAAFAAVHQIAEDIGDRSNVTSAADRDLEINNHVGIATLRTVGAPGSGPYASDPYAVEVTLSVQKRLGFSSMFLASTPTIRASATATVVPDGEYCVVSLENTAATGITATGSATVDMGCGMITNSTSLTAAVATGASNVTASPIAAVGGINESDNWGDGTVLQPFTLAEEDPYADVYPPSNFPTSSCPQFRVNANVTRTSLTANVDYRATSDGYYCMGSMTLNGDVTLPSGIYVVDAGSISVGSQAHVTCSNCTFILTSRTAATDPSSIGNLNINGGAEVNLTATTAGIYHGILFYQDRRAVNGTDANHQSFFNGNADSTLQGSFYFPNQRLTFNGTAGMTTDCLQLVARTVSYSGNLNISNTCPANSGASAFAGKKIRLVA